MPPPVVDRRALLGRLPLFSELAPPELDAVVAVTRRDALRRRATSSCARESRRRWPSRSCTGRLKVVTRRGSRQEAVVGVLRKGEVFGELAILDGGARSATVIAIAPTLLLAIDRRKLHALLVKEPTVSYKLLIVLARRLRQLIGAREVLDVPARLAKQLMQLADEDGEHVADGVRLRTELSQRELGAMIGATRESVNKNLAALAKRGVVRSDGRQLVVVNPAALRAAAGGARRAAGSTRRARASP